MGRARDKLAHPIDLPVRLDPDPEWCLVEEGFVLTREHEIESLFAVGNGYVGTRGSLVEESGLSARATFVAGVFDRPRRPGAVPELARLPDWTHVEASIDDRPLRLHTGDSPLHRRTLDMQNGELWREWRHRDPAGRLTNVRGFRLASQADRHLLIQSVAFTPENYSGTVRFETEMAHDHLLRTATGVEVALRMALFLHTPERVVELLGRERPFELEVELGCAYRFDRLVVVMTSRDVPRPAEAAAAHLDEVLRTQSIERLVKRHRRAWAARWRSSDLRIEGDPFAQRAIRFAIYHLLSAANPDDDRVSIGARALTGAAYKGHVFWDTEIYMLPFFTLTLPEAARSLLLYRHHTLSAARERAAEHGYRGALYAWESADEGEESTPPFVLAPDGEVVRILAGEQEHHISADVAYGVYRYWDATGDDRFLLDAGAEILIETARFWASRAELGDDGRYHIRGVMGPDEYHESVDDNAFTNGMAAWNLEVAAEIAELVEARWPERWTELSERLLLDEEEHEEWLRVANGMYSGFDERTGLFEQFRGYFSLQEIDLAALEPRTAPVDLLLGREAVSRSKAIKQPDVVMLVHLLWDRFPPSVREANYRYYEPRCAHGSSLSPSIHALVAARLGDIALAERYFTQAAKIDLADEMGNAAGGVHAASLGGMWQAIVFGFAGLDLGAPGGPRLHPNLPAHWRLSFRVRWRGQIIEVALPGDRLAESPRLQEVMT